MNTKAEEERKITAVGADCPDCGREANYIHSTHIHNGILDTGYYASVDCQHCGYHEYLGYFGPDV